MRMDARRRMFVLNWGGFEETGGDVLFMHEGPLSGEGGI